jgi:NAD kinase
MIVYKDAQSDFVKRLKEGALFEDSVIVSVKKTNDLVVIVTGDGSVFHVHRKNKAYNIFRKTNKSAERN